MEGKFNCMLGGGLYKRGWENFPKLIVGWTTIRDPTVFP